jgi:hypothetical protein
MGYITYFYTSLGMLYVTLFTKVAPHDHGESAFVCIAINPDRDIQYRVRQCPTKFCNAVNLQVYMSGIPRHLRRCALCNQGVGDEKHLVPECIALIHLRSRFQHLFWHGCAMSSFMNQDAQRGVMYLVTDCLQFHL